MCGGIDDCNLMNRNVSYDRPREIEELDEIRGECERNQISTFPHH